MVNNIRCYLSKRRRVRTLSLLGSICIFGVVQSAHATLLYSASLKNGDYGGGHIVDAFKGTTCSSAAGYSSPTCGDDDLSDVGITDTPNGVNYTSRNAVINYSLGADGKGGTGRITFRTTGTISVSFKADLQAFVSGQPFVDNYGFNQFRGGQALFGTGLSREPGVDGTSGTTDDRISVGWSTWHSGVWFNHVTTPLLITGFEDWHDLGFAWGGPNDQFEVWVDGVLRASHDVPSSGAWGIGAPGLGAAYNLALGMIHERAHAPTGYGSPAGIMFADLEIWDEYRAFGATTQPGAAPVPSSIALLGLGLAGLGFARRKKLN